MMRRLFDQLYGSVADFESAVGLEESVKRLSAATERSVLGAWTHQAAIGRVSTNRVSLQRVIPFVGNSFKPCYIGKFRQINGRVVLTGRFTMLWWVKAFMTFWFGFCILWTALAMLPLLARDPHTWWFPFAGAGMLAAVVAFVALCKRLSRNDVPWLSKVIEDALSKEPPNSRFQSDAPHAARA
jgi:hypothetical protein